MVEEVFLIDDQGVDDQHMVGAFQVGLSVLGIVQQELGIRCAEFLAFQRGNLVVQAADGLAVAQVSDENGVFVVGEQQHGRGRLIGLSWNGSRVCC